MLEYFPALERALDYSQEVPLILWVGFHTPGGVRHVGLPRLTSWLRKRRCRNSAKVEQISATDSDVEGVDAQIKDLFGSTTALMS